MLRFQVYAGLFFMFFSLTAGAEKGDSKANRHGW